MEEKLYCEACYWKWILSNEARARKYEAENAELIFKRRPGEITDDKL